MDPISQGVVGAALPQALHKQRHFFLAGLFGLLGGMAPDLDTFIRSEQDPLLYLEFHRQFTHSLIFIPVGGGLCAGLLYLLLRRRLSLSFKLTYLFCTLGYATHGFLDAATSYGTQLFWPFSDERVALSYISIVDPLFTLPMLVLVVLSAWRGKATYARYALIWGLFYLGLGAYQHHGAIQMGEEIARSRGHTPATLSVKPSFGNLLVWKVIYRHKDTYYVDAVRTGLRPMVFEGSSIIGLNIERDFPWLDPTSQQAEDIKRFSWFSNGHLAQDPADPNRIIDLRYSMLPHTIDGLWSIELSEDADQQDHAKFVIIRKSNPTQAKKLWQMISGSGEAD